MSRTIFLIGESQRDYAKRSIDEAPADYVCKIAKATRSDRQNRKMWAMIKDMCQQIEGMNRFTADQVKLQFLNALGVEMTFLPELDGQGMFPVGMRSSTLTKEQFAGLITLMLAYGDKHEVRWSKESLEP
jgi:hypothetical protein